MDRKQSRIERRDFKAAARADADGSGPTLEERPAARFPGASAKFALLGEVLLVGLLVTLVGVLVVTLPVALAAGARHLRRYIRAESSSMGQFFTDVRRGLLGGVAVGAAAALIAGVLALDIVVASSGALPGGMLFTAIGWVGLTAVGVVLLAVSGLWTPDHGWRGAFRMLPARLGRDIAGTAYLAATVGFVGVVTWALTPLIIPALGCAVLATIAIPERPRR